MPRDHMMGWTGHQMFQEHADEKKKYVTPPRQRFTAAEDLERAALDITKPVTKHKEPKNFMLYADKCTINAGDIMSSTIIASQLTVVSGSGLIAKRSQEMQEAFTGITTVAKHEKVRQDKLKLQDHIELMRRKNKA